ncbi:MAG TPA: hypothetical protein VGT03_00240 [Candidatus Acidoferrales bacterium]|nr:hypothetical protein [Candidatus Acidoferrales bacterium]
MVFKRELLTGILLAFAMILVPAGAASAQAAAPQTKSPQHVVTPGDLQKDVAASIAIRQANEAKIEKLFATPQAREAMKKAGINYKVVRQAVPQLSAEELASLAARADKAQKQFDAGALNNQQLTYIIIALATAVIVILIVKA